jgi:hypothetical protein
MQWGSWTAGESGSVEAGSRTVGLFASVWHYNGGTVAQRGHYGVGQ